MKDTSEFTDATEQAKRTSSRTRSARSKNENTTPSSQEQETKPAPRRRTSSTTSGATTARTSRGSESTSATAPKETEHTSATPGAAENAPTTTRTRTSQRSDTTPGAAGGAAQTPTRAHPSQRSGATSEPRTSSTAPTSRTSGSPSTQRRHPQGQPTSRGNGGPANSSAPRPATHYPAGSSGPSTQRQGQGYGSQHRSPHPSGQAGTSTTYRSGAPAGSRGPTAGSRGPATGSRGPSTGTRPPQRGTAPSGTRPPSQGNRPGTARRPAPSSRSQDRRVAAVKEKPSGPLYIPPQILVKDLAELLKVSPVEVIRLLIKHGVFANINQVVDYEPAASVAQDIGFEPMSTPPQAQSAQSLSASEAMVATREELNTIHIPPVVTIMGHVDHGKTSLLDVIRKTKVAVGEAGGITQHIGAYQVEINGKKITFLDTPGHEAFTAMRARGAQTAHIAIIVIAADDGVMPQTREAIDHAQAAKMPIIIALNKIDRANANPDRVKQQLTEIGLVVEEYGGETICVPVSARQGIGIDELLEYILLVAEMQDIRANPNRPATGVIIEAKLERSSGPTATVLVQQGTLKMGDNFVVGSLAGKVRAMFNDRGKRIQKAPPSTPVSILGLPEVPQAGDHLEVMPDERTARQKAQEEIEQRRTEASMRGQVSLDTLYVQMQEGSIKELNVVLKTDVQGSSEAIKGALTKLGEENLKVRLIHEGVGNISETDVHLAAASGAIIIGFNVKADGAAQREAQRENVDIRYYEVIYKLIDDIQAALKGLLEPTIREVIDGHAEVLQTFQTKKIVIAGCRITDGKLTRSSSIRVIRQDEKVFDGPIASLRRGKDDVREVLSGYECGVLLDGFNEFEVGDILEAYSQERVKAGA